jgi:hypothetical protein
MMMLYVKDHPDFSDSRDRPDELVVFVVLTGLLVAIYLLWFIISMMMAFFSICSMMPRLRGLFAIHCVVLVISIAMIFAGAFANFYYDGGVFMFFLTFYNAYIMYLMILSTPSRVEGMNLI